MPSRLEVTYSVVLVKGIELIRPPTWTVQLADFGGSSSESEAYAITVPETSSAREGDLIVKLKGGSGQLHARVPVTGRVV